VSKERVKQPIEQFGLPPTNPHFRCRPDDREQAMHKALPEQIGGTIEVICALADTIIIE
jgi:hypothetical protein